MGSSKHKCDRTRAAKAADLAKKARAPAQEATHTFEKLVQQVDNYDPSWRELRGDDSPLGRTHRDMPKNGSLGAWQDQNLRRLASEGSPEPDQSWPLSLLVPLLLMVLMYLFSRRLTSLWVSQGQRSVRKKLPTLSRERRVIVTPK